MSSIPIEGVRYNEVRQKSVHNTFQRSESIADQFLYWRVRSMEIDVHHSDVFGNSTKGDWAVHHDWYDPISTVAKLSQFLRMVRGLNRLVPQHEVLTLFIDIKDPFPKSATAHHGWRAFDELLTKELGSRLYRPANLLRRSRGATRLRESLEARGWPTLTQLRGKIIVVLTGSPTQLANYAAGPRAALTRSAFLSAPVDAARDIPGSGDEVFFNISGEKNMHLVSKVHPLGCIARAYYVNTPEQWHQAAEAQCHHLATDKVNERIDPWAVTRNSTGFPFEHVDGHAIDATEPGEASGVWARTDDLWGEDDSFVFSHRRATPATISTTLDFAIAGPNSHTENFVKGALMARAGLKPDDPYFAVVRLGQKHGLRVQFRARRGAPTTSISTPIGPSGAFGYDIDQDTIVHVRLEVDRKGKRARAWGSYDRGTRAWQLLGAFEFRTPLRYQGLAVSSHGQPNGSKFLFVPAPRTRHSSFPDTSLIGAAGDHDGWADPSGTGRWRTSGFGEWRGAPTKPLDRRA